MKVKRATYADLKFVAENMRSRDRTEIFCCRNDDRAESLAYEIYNLQWLVYPVSLIFTLNDDTPVAYLGISRLSPTLGQAHMFATDDFKLIWRDMVRHILNHVIPACKDELGFTRVEARAQKSYRLSRRFLTALGFTFECALPQYGKNGECFMQYARLA